MRSRDRARTWHGTESVPCASARRKPGMKTPGNPRPVAKTFQPKDPRRAGCRFSVQRRPGGRPKPKRCPFRDTAKVEVRGEHDQVVPDTELGEKRIDRSDLNAVAPATIAQLRGLDVVLARRSDHRQRAETIQDPGSGFRSLVPLQQLLEHDAGSVDRLSPDQGLPQSRHFRSFRGRVPAKGQRPYAGVDKQGHERLRSRL